MNDDAIFGVSVGATELDLSAEYLDLLTALSDAITVVGDGSLPEMQAMVNR